MTSQQAHLIYEFGEFRLDALRRVLSARADGSPVQVTGKIISSQFARNEPARVTGAMVSFEAGARTAWHKHPLGQTLIVTAGSGWVRQGEGERQEIHESDVIWIPPNVKHWHGATASERMTHTAIQERLGKGNVEWLEQVTDEQYRAAKR